MAERGAFETENRRVVAEGGKPASGRPELMGITCLLYTSRCV